jgi:ribonuclease VapC
VIFIDTSALIAVLVEDDDAAILGAKIDDDTAPITSAAVILEASTRLSTIWAIDPRVARQHIETLLTRTGIEIMPIDSRVGQHAVEAFARYGKGRHPARLNFADCLSYACAKVAGATLVYKGNDFGQTDLG